MPVYNCYRTVYCPAGNFLKLQRRNYRFSSENTFLSNWFSSFASLLQHHILLNLSTVSIFPSSSIWISKNISIFHHHSNSFCLNFSYISILSVSISFGSSEAKKTISQARSHSCMSTVWPLILDVRFWKRAMIVYSLSYP